MTSFPVSGPRPAVLPLPCLPVSHVDDLVGPKDEVEAEALAEGVHGVLSEDERHTATLPFSVFPRKPCWGGSRSSLRRGPPTSGRGQCPRRTRADSEASVPLRSLFPAFRFSRDFESAMNCEMPPCMASTRPSMSAQSGSSLNTSPALRRALFEPPGSAARDGRSAFASTPRRSRRFGSSSGTRGCLPRFFSRGN